MIQKIALTLLIVFTGFEFLFAQIRIVDECGRKMSLYKEFVNKKYYERAYPLWQVAYDECPDASKNIYIDGAKIMKHFLQKFKDDSLKYQIYLDSLMLVYEQRMKYYQQEAFVKGLIAADLFMYAPSETQRAYKLMKYSVTQLATDADPAFMNILLLLSEKMYRNDSIGANTFINNYLQCDTLLQKKLNAVQNDGDVRRINTVQTNMRKILARSDAANCEQLETIFAPKVEENPFDMTLLKYVSGLLNERECTSSSLYIKCAENLYLVEPDAESAKSMAKYFASKKEYEKAVKYYKQAIDFETNEEEKAKYCYALAYIYYAQQQYEKCRNAAKQAIDLKPDYGKAYILIGNAYAASSKQIGKTDFEHKSAYWVAVDMFKKAKEVDSSLADEADSYIENYSPHFPARKDAFFLHLSEGETYTVGGWINKETKVRFSK